LLLTQMYRMVAIVYISYGLLCFFAGLY